jgi:hypothetical protein
MAKLKTRAARKAAKVSAKHAIHGTVAKSRRAPFRSGALVALGASLGAAVGWLAARTRYAAQDARPLT